MKLSEFDSRQEIEKYPGGGEGLLRDIWLTPWFPDDVDEAHRVVLFQLVLKEFLDGHRMTASERRPTKAEHVKSLDEAFYLKRRNPLPRTQHDHELHRRTYYYVEANRQDRRGEKRTQEERSAWKFVRERAGLPMVLGLSAPSNARTVWAAVARRLWEEGYRVEGKPISEKRLEAIYREEKPKWEGRPPRQVGRRSHRRKHKSAED